MKNIPFGNDPTKTFQILRKVNKLKDLSKKDLRHFTNYGKLCQYDENETIIKEGDKHSWVHFLMNGSVTILKEGNVIGSLAKCGDVFGEVGAVVGSTRSATVIAATKVWVLSFDSSALNTEIKDKDPKFCYLMYKIFAEVMAERLRQTTEEKISLQSSNNKKQANVAKAPEQPKQKADTATTPQPASAAKSQVKYSKDIDILIIDSTEVTRKILRSILRDLGFKRIIEAADGERAMNIIQSENIDLVISEWNTSRLQGLELLKKIRKNPKKSSLAFIMILEETDRKNIKRAATAQVSQCLLRPFTPNDVLNKIKTVLA